MSYSTLQYESKRDTPESWRHGQRATENLSNDGDSSAQYRISMGINCTVHAYTKCSITAYQVAYVRKTILNPEVSCTMRHVHYDVFDGRAQRGELALARLSLSVQVAGQFRTTRSHDRRFASADVRRKNSRHLLFIPFLSILIKFP